MFYNKALASMQGFDYCENLHGTIILLCKIIFFSCNMANCLLCFGDKKLQSNYA